MSDSQEAKRERTAAKVEASLRSAAGGRLWSAEDFDRAAQFGLTPANIFVPGDTFTLGTVNDYVKLGFANTSPDPLRGLTEYLGQKSESLQDFQARTGGLPLVFNADGTATYDPSVQRVAYSYDNPDDGAFHKIAPLVFATVAGAGLGGFLPGTESVFSGLGSAAAGAAETVPGFGASATFTAADTAAVSFGAANITEATIAGASLGGVAGAGLTETFLVSDVATGSNALQTAAAKAGSSIVTPSSSAASGALDVFKTGASVVSAGAGLVQSAAVLDNALSGGTKAPATALPIISSGTPNPTVIHLGTDMATKTSTAQPTATTPAPTALNLQSLLPIAVLVVAVLALSGEMKGE